MLRTVLVLATAAVLVSPGAMAQTSIENPTDSTPTSLYFHIWDPFNKFVTNTQPYNASFFDVGGVNFPTIEQRGWDFNTIFGYSTAGPVEYEFNENGRPRLHPERGIAAEVEIDESVTPTAYLYVDARALDGDEGTPGILPQMTFSVRMREGDDPGSDFTQGNMIMGGQVTAWLYDGKFCPSAAGNINSLVLVGCTFQGQDTTIDPHSVSGGYGSYPQSGPDGNPVLYPSEDGIIEVAIPLQIANPKISKEKAFNLEIQWWQEFNGLQGEDAFAQGNMRIVMDDAHQSRIDMNIFNPVYISFVHPQVAAGTLLIHTGMNSPWGTYDVDVENIEISVEGPSEPQNLERVVAQNKHVHGLHDKDAEVTYLWKFRDEGAELGEYTIHLAVRNNGQLDADGNILAESQRTATAEAGFVVKKTEAFGIDDTGTVVPETVPDDEKSTPGFIGLFAMAALGAIAIMRRRWDE